MVFGHNLLDPVLASGPWGVLWTMLHRVGPVSPFGAPFPRVFILYPVLPWPGVMALGFALGRCYRQDPARRRRLLGRPGTAGLLLFVLIRAWGGYGDPAPWSVQTTWFRTALSFVNTTKYPPSLLYLLMTISPALLLLAWREGRDANPLDRALSILGRVPMFFYLLQWPVAHGMGVLFHALAGKPWRSGNRGLGLGCLYQRLDALHQAVATNGAPWLDSLGGLPGPWSCPERRNRHGHPMQLHAVTPWNAYNVYKDVGKFSSKIKH